MKIGDYVIIKTYSQLEQKGYLAAYPYIFKYINCLGQITAQETGTFTGTKFFRIKIGSNDRTWFPEDAIIKYKGGV